jgi:hypothetical protein
MNDEGLADAEAANPFRLPRLHAGIGLAYLAPDEGAKSKQGRVDRPPVEETEDAELCRLTEVAMMQAADFGKLHDPLRRGELDRPEVGCVLVAREVGPCLMVIGEILGRDATEVALAEDEHVVHALPPGPRRVAERSIGRWGAR